MTIVGEREEQAVHVERFGSAIVRGIVAGLVAGIPQVLLVQVETRLLGLPDQHADIGPRFVQQLGRRLGSDPSQPMQWTFAAIFHFAYATWWGTVYAVFEEWRPAKPHVAGPLLGSLIYALAFSPWGGATQTGTVRSTEERPLQESLVHWTAALSFSLTTAYVYEWLRRRRTSLHLAGRLARTVV